jgi:asparagine synthase (glutamine-hydrolysing)
MIGIVKSLRRTHPRGWSGQGLLSADFTRRLQLADKQNHVGNRQYSPFVNARHEHYIEMTSGLISMALELFDKLSAAFSLDVRFPFFDRRLMEYCLAIPRGLILHQGWTRYILRTAMQGVLPEEIQWRISKANLPAVFAPQLLIHEGITLDRAFLQEPDFLPNFIDNNILRDAYSRYRANPIEHLSEAYTIFGAITLQNWFKYAKVKST